LLGEAEGGFTWDSDGSETRFLLHASGTANPFETVLGFLASAEVVAIAPSGWTPNFGAGEKAAKKREAWEEKVAQGQIAFMDAFPGPPPDSEMALPIRLRGSLGGHAREVVLGHWTDGSSRDAFKLYSGNRSALQIARAMIHGAKAAEGIRQIYLEERQSVVAAPFDRLTAMGGSFNFDARAGWKALDLGFSPNEHDSISVLGSPVVELLAAWGLQHARPAGDEADPRRVRYAIWKTMLPPVLARPTLAGCTVPGIETRRFTFELEQSGKNKIIQFAEEEMLP